MNIASLVIRTTPELRSQVENALKAMPGVEIAHCEPGVPLIVTVEDTPQRAAIDIMTDIHKLTGVVAASLAYHYTDDTLENA